MTEGKYGTGKGWDKLIEPLVTKANEEGVKIYQIKEKFGGLRFYTDSCSPEFHRMIADAENESFKTCESCGAPGKRRAGSWIKTLCDNCEKK